MAPSAISRPVRGLWRWWRDEIAALGAALGRRPEVLTVSGAEGVLCLTHVGRRGTRRLGELLYDISAPEAAGKALARLVARAPGRFDRIEILPAPGRGLSRRIVLPIAARDSLVETLGYDIDRQTPFAADQVHFGAALEAIDREAGTLEARLDVVLRREIDPVARLLSAAGLAPDAVRLAPGTGPDLAPDAMRRTRPAWRRRLGTGLALAVLVLGALALHLPRANLAAALDAARSETAAVRRAAAEVGAIRRETERLVAREARLIELKATRTPALSLLAEATARIPDNAFATALEIGQGRLSVTGHAEGAAALLSAIEASPAFGGARFTAALFPDARLGRERFALSATLAGAGEVAQ